MHFSPGSDFFSDIPKIVLEFIWQYSCNSIHDFSKYIDCTSNVSFFGLPPNWDMYVWQMKGDPHPSWSPKSFPTSSPAEWTVWAFCSLLESVGLVQGPLCLHGREEGKIETHERFSSQII
jgi:hypothetical protein